MVSRDTAGTALVGAGVGVFVLMLVVSAALAPAIGTADAADGETRRTLVGSQGGGPGLHEHGSVYLLNGTDVVWREGSAGSYFDVTMLDNGSVMAGFMHGGYQQCGPYDAPCVHTGFRIIDPTPRPHVVHEYSFPVRTRKNSEVHDVELLPSGEFLVTDMDRERIFTVKGGEVTWQWNASSIYDAPADPTRVDWLHINDVDVIGQGRYLVSVRNANQLVIVERGKGVVEIINEDEPGSSDASCLGRNQLVDSGDGVRCGDPSVLDHQHNPQWLGNGTVLVADSENDRIVELSRTPGGDWKVTWTLHAAGGVGFSWPRDADRLANGNTLITDSANQRLVEVNESGAVVWSYKTPYVPYEAERLPEGEAVGNRSAYGTDGGDGSGGMGTDAARGSDDVPVLSFLLQAARTSFPLPFWLSELHVGLTLVCLGAVLTGAWLRLVPPLRVLSRSRS